jgi:hypothetical protein
MQASFPARSILRTPYFPSVTFAGPRHSSVAEDFEDPMRRIRDQDRSNLMVNGFSFEKESLKVIQAFCS